jgi:hypothetical protein
MNIELIGGPLDGAFVKVSDPPPRQICLPTIQVSIPPAYGFWPQQQLPQYTYLRHRRKGRAVYFCSLIKLHW